MLNLAKGLFGSAISISAILKIVFLKSSFLKSHRRLIKHAKKYFFYQSSVWVKLAYNCDFRPNR
jgi:hypothetical protein